ncbi:MAG TPA: energy transducer TonB [Polyangia bacterium]
MPFEGFLGDLRTRPLGLRLLGYAASITIHVPPLTLFAVAWLTRALVLDHALDLPTPRSSLVYYNVPVQMLDGIPGGLFGETRAPRGIAHARTAGGRAGNAGAGKRRSRRPLTYSHAHKRVMGPVAPPKPVGHDEFGAVDGTGTGHHGKGFGDHGAGSGERVGEDGHGGTVGGLAGAGSGRDGRGRNGEAVSLEAKLASWIPPELGKNERARGSSERDHGQQGDEAQPGMGMDDEKVVGPPLPGRPQRISMNFAAYLRTYDPIPSLPDSCWPPGRLLNVVKLEICVSERGTVDDVTVRQSLGNEPDQFIMATVRNWRYRPRLVHGSARPFCHPITIEYSRSQPYFFGR